MLHFGTLRRDTLPLSPSTGSAVWTIIRNEEPAGVTLRRGFEFIGRRAMHRPGTPSKTY